MSDQNKDRRFNKDAILKEIGAESFAREGGVFRVSDDQMVDILLTVAPELQILKAAKLLKTASKAKINEYFVEMEKETLAAAEKGAVEAFEKAKSALYETHFGRGGGQDLAAYLKEVEELTVHLKSSTEVAAQEAKNVVEEVRSKILQKRLELKDGVVKPFLQNGKDFLKYEVRPFAEDAISVPFKILNGISRGVLGAFESFPVLGDGLKKLEYFVRDKIYLAWDKFYNPVGKYKAVYDWKKAKIEESFAPKIAEIEEKVKGLDVSQSTAQTKIRELKEQEGIQLTKLERKYTGPDGKITKANQKPSSTATNTFNPQSLLLRTALWGAPLLVFRLEVLNPIQEHLATMRSQITKEGKNAYRYSNQLVLETIDSSFGAGNYPLGSPSYDNKMTTAAINNDNQIQGAQNALIKEIAFDVAHHYATKAVASIVSYPYSAIPSKITHSIFSSDYAGTLAATENAVSQPETLVDKAEAKINETSFIQILSNWHDNFFNHVPGYKYVQAVTNDISTALYDPKNIQRFQLQAQQLVSETKSAHSKWSDADVADFVYSQVSRRMMYDAVEYAKEHSAYTNPYAESTVQGASPVSSPAGGENASSGEAPSKINAPASLPVPDKKAPPPSSIDIARPVAKGIILKKDSKIEVPEIIAPPIRIPTQKELQKEELKQDLQRDKEEYGKMTPDLLFPSSKQIASTGGRYGSLKGMDLSSVVALMGNDKVGDVGGRRAPTVLASANKLSGLDA